MSAASRPRPQFKVWLETDEGYVFGPGVYSLLRQVEETGTLKKAAERLGMSYRFAWGIVKKAERKLGLPLFRTHKGGKSGGGGTEITAEGREYMDYFSTVIKNVEKLSEYLPEFHNDILNEVKAKVVEIQDEGNTSILILETLEGFIFRTRIVNQKIPELSPGDEVLLEYTILVNKLSEHTVKDS